MKKLLSLFALAGSMSFAAAPVASAQGYTLETLWDKVPDDYSQFLVTSHLERGMAYNPTTDHLLIPSRNDNAIHIIDAADGTYIGELDNGSGVIGGGTFLINKIAVADDGAIYVGNLVTSVSESSPFRLYRWADESSPPVPVFIGNPSNGGGGPRWGDSLDVRGSGADTEVIVGDTNGTTLAVLRPGTADPAAADSYTADVIWTSVSAGHMKNIAFGPNNLVYVTAVGHDLYELDVNFENLAVDGQRVFGGAHITRYLGPLGYGTDEDILAGVLPGSHQLWVYRRTHLSTEWTVQPIATTTFRAPLTDGSYVDNGNGVGAAIVVGNIIYALDTNNGIIAAQLTPAELPEPGDIFWSNADAIRTAEIDGSNPRTIVSGLSRPIGMAIDAANGHIYWAEDGAGRIARGNLDGTEVTTILSDRGDAENPDPVANPQGIALLDGRIYWSEYSNGLYSANLDGSDVQHLIDVTSAASSEGTSALAWDEVTEKVYLSATIAGILYEINPDGTALEADSTVAPNAYGLAFDGAGTLFRTNFSDGVIDTYESVDPLFEGRGQPLGIAVSEDGSQLFWAERTGGNILMANADGSGDVTTLVSGEDSPFGFTLMPTVAGGEDYASWITAQSVAPEDQGTEADPDGDGLSNLLEYALGGDPATANSEIAPLLGTETVGESTYLSIAFTKNANAQGIDYVVEASSDLVTWESAGSTTVVEDATTAIIRDNVALTDSDRRFIRLRVVEQ